MRANFGGRIDLVGMRGRLADAKSGKTDLPSLVQRSDCHLPWQSLLMSSFMAGFRPEADTEHQPGGGLSDAVSAAAAIACRPVRR